MTISLWAAGIAAGILLLVGLGYIFQGYAVPKFWYPVAIGCAVVGAIAGVVARRCSYEEATEVADEVFNLSDAVTSEESFKKEKKSGGLYDLQKEATIEAVQALKPSALKFEFPRKLALASAVLIGAAGLTAFKSPSAEVVAKIELEETTLALTEEFSEKLKEELEELEKGIDDPEERKLLEADKIRKWVDELEETKDQKEAMRQMANLEKKLTSMANKMAQRKAEQVLAKAAKELNKEKEHKQLAQKLKQQKYKEAAQELEKLKPMDKKLSEQKKKLAKLKSATKRMAAAAKTSKSKSKGNQGKNSDGGKGEKMEDLLESLAQDVEEYGDELEDLELADLKGELTDEKFDASEASKMKIGDKLGELGKQLGKLSAAKKLQKKLLGMTKKLGQCQGCLAGQCQSPFAAPGGKMAGNGSIESRRDEKDELADNGQTTQLKGLKGKGASLTKLEAAEDGTGVSGRRAEAKQRSFKSQYESFVQREDVPEDVKEGVKEYFTAIHEAENGVVEQGAEKE